MVNLGEKLWMALYVVVNILNFILLGEWKKVEGLEERGGGY